MSNKEVMNQMETKNIVHGYKVFNPDWTCNPIGAEPKQYTCPSKFEEEGELKICGHGMHFCQMAIDCFRYYGFNPKNKVAEVIAYGNVITKGDKSCTDKLEIVRELTWEEVLRLVNIGENCTGYGNTGDSNIGNYNTGKRNSGRWNTGDNNKGRFNAGDGNTGNYNTGDNNTGNRNTGHRNTGYFNTGGENAGSYNTGHNNAGKRNTGDGNSGMWNTGNWNTGKRNTGDGNSGMWNTGDGNSGNRNTGYDNTGNDNTGCWNIGDNNAGDCNKSSFNSGCFNVKEHKIMLFDKPSEWTYKDWIYSEARLLLNNILPNSVKWVDADDMTVEEKEENPSYATTGGYLKRITVDVQKRWNELSEHDKNTIKAIPNFDADIFFECTGIRVE